MVFTVLETFTRPQLKEAWGQQLNHTQCSTHETLSKDEQKATDFRVDT